MWIDLVYICILYFYWVDFRRRYFCFNVMLDNKNFWPKFRTIIIFKNDISISFRKFILINNNQISLTTFYLNFFFVFFWEKIFSFTVKLNTRSPVFDSKRAWAKTQPLYFFAGTFLTRSKISVFARFINLTPRLINFCFI